MGVKVNIGSVFISLQFNWSLFVTNVLPNICCRKRSVPLSEQADKITLMDDVCFIVLKEFYDYVFCLIFYKLDFLACHQ
jgi:hypothetical protein